MYLFQKKSNLSVRWKIILRYSENMQPLRQKMQLTTEKMVMTYVMRVMRHVLIHKFHLNGPTVHSLYA